MDHNQFQNLGFHDFKRMARDQSLSRYEKIGFPDSYRENTEPAIFADIQQKLPHLAATQKRVLDIGPGCSELPLMLIEACQKNHHQLTLVDSQEMLSQLPNPPHVTHIAGYYPHCPELESYPGKLDVILCYSVLHYVFTEGNLWAFLDFSLSLLAPQGQMLLGDIPNISKRKRFFSSDSGVKFHRQFMNTTGKPEVAFNTLEPAQIDDAVIFAILMRARNQGFDAYVLPQDDGLPMANRREDILITRP